MNAWTRWEQLCGRREDALVLAIVRVMLGVTVLGHVAHLEFSGALRWVWLDDSHGGLRDIGNGPIAVIGGASPEVVYAMSSVALLGAVGMVLGLGRWPTWVVWLCYGNLADLNTHAGGSYDELISSMCFILGLSGAHLRLTVLRVGETSTFVAWRWLLVLQLVVMYTSSGIQKVSAHWVPWGDHMALWYILQQPSWQRMPMLWLAPAAPLLQVATVVSWFFEVGAVVLLLAAWFRHTRLRAGWVRAWFNRLDLRRWWLLVGLGMHLGIELTMEVGAFSYATLALYLACFSSDEVQAALRRVRFW